MCVLISIGPTYECTECVYKPPTGECKLDTNIPPKPND